MDHNAPIHSLISGRNPRTLNDEWEIAQHADIDHLIESLGPLYQLSPWEMRVCFDELAKRNPPLRSHPLLLDHPEQLSPEMSIDGEHHILSTYSAAE